MKGNSSCFVLAEDRCIKTKAKTISLAFTDFVLIRLIFFGCSMVILPQNSGMTEFDADVILPSLGRIINRPLKTLY